MEQHGSADDSLDYHNNLYPNLKKILKYLLRKRFGESRFSHDSIYQ
jgi:hypothetical protein